VKKKKKVPFVFPEPVNVRLAEMLSFNKNTVHHLP